MPDMMLAKSCSNQRSNHTLGLAFSVLVRFCSADFRGIIFDDFDKKLLFVIANSEVVPFIYRICI